MPGRRHVPGRVLGKAARARAGREAKLDKAGRPAQEAGQLPGRGQDARGRRPAARGGRGLPRRPGVLGRGRDLRAHRQGPRRRPSSTSRPATTRRRPSSSSTRASPARRRCSSRRRATTSRRRGSSASPGSVGQGRRALREERLSAARGRGLREEGRVPQGRRGLREALHGERLLLHHLLLDRAQHRPEERAPGGPALREGGRSRSGPSRSTPRAATSRRRPRPLVALGQFDEGGRALHAGRGSGERGRAPSSRRATWCSAANLRGEVALQGRPVRPRPRPSS